MQAVVVTEIARLVRHRWSIRAVIQAVVSVARHVQLVLQRTLLLLLFLFGLAISHAFSLGFSW